jgi:putative ABC transport system permease protein
MKYRIKIPFYLAWQYIRRGRKWTLALTIFLISIAFMNLLFVSSLFEGIVEGSNQRIRDTISGDIYIVPQKGETTIKPLATTLEKIRQIDGVAAASATTLLPGTIEYDSITGQGTLYAITPSADAITRTLANDTHPGTFLKDDDTTGIILGKQIAGGESIENNAFSFKGAKIGDTVTVTLGGLKKDFIIRGILDTGFINADTTSYITTKALAEITPTFDDAATTIIVKLAKDQNIDQVLSDIQKTNLKISAYPWQDAAGIMQSISQSFISINALMTIVGILIAAITVFIVIYIDILNKKRQIGIFKAIGINPAIIVTSYLLLSAVYAFVGILIGTILFYALAVPFFDAHPIKLPITDARLVLVWPEYIWRSEVVFWVAIISGLIPSLLVSRSKMLESILGSR